ncbi:hypothetical protein KIL84_018659 [Mauremys mutica]|uniref:Uncharacterized protein n=1 Tax=Mauremys mutica TaxID=74926 RepID=A0A9D4B9X3_9SAUR|nr:hypothetical protein KIL84_018659 [Mauremys mutica]
MQIAQWGISESSPLNSVATLLLKPFHGKGPGRCSERSVPLQNWCQWLQTENRCKRKKQKSIHHQVDLKGFSQGGKDPAGTDFKIIGLVFISLTPGISINF